MSNTVSLEEVRTELSAYPQVMVMPFDPKRDPAHADLTVDLNGDGRQKFPKLTDFVEQARQAVNASSSLDTKIPPADVIYITNDPDFSGFATLMLRDDGKRYLIMRTDLLLAFGNDSALALLTHEYKHSHHHDSGKLGSMSDVERQSTELEADRAAEQPVGMAASLLVLMTSTQFVNNYYPNKHDKQHPPFQDRIRALLEEAYGNEIFRDSGKFEQDWRFHPKRQDFMPVRENGQKVLNWDSEFAPAIQKLVESDIRYLDRLVGKPAHTLEPEVIQQFIDHVIPRIENFHNKHTFNVALPGNDYLAKQFEKALEVPALREAVMSMHEKMPLAFQAYDQAVQQSKHFTTLEAQDLIINTARQHIVDGISEGKYPETKQIETAVEYVSMPMANAVEMGH